MRKDKTQQKKLDNETQWSSMYEMFKRFLDLYDVLPNLDMPEIDDLLPDTLTPKIVETLCKRHAEMDSITMRLHDPGTTLLDNCMLFDGIIDCFPSVQTMHNRLRANDGVLKNLNFESAFVKVQEEYEQKLIAAEKKLCSIY